MLTAKSLTRRYILLLTALIFAILLLGVGVESLVFAGKGQSKHLSQPDTAQLFSLVSPAQALSIGKPTLFFFYPLDTCRMQYCRQPLQIAAELSSRYGEQLNFVAVALNTITYGPYPLSSPEYPLVGWDAYPLESFDWLPEAIHTAVENDLPGAEVFLVDALGKLEYQGQEFFSWMDLEAQVSSTQ
jgi:hypothetical protein